MRGYRFTHEKLVACQMSKGLGKKVYVVTGSFPKEERFGLIDQARRAGVSVMSNLAEGSGRTTAKDQAYFSQLAYGSLMELDAQLQLAVDLGYMENTAYLEIRQTVEELSATINGLRIAQLKKEKT